METESEFSELLCNLLVICVAIAEPVPSRDSPPSAELERMTDEYCLRFAKTLQADELSPQIAGAMILRLRGVGNFASMLQGQFDRRRELGDASADESGLLKFALVDVWHQVLKAQWLAGVYE